MVTFCKQGRRVVSCTHDTDFWHFQMCTPKFEVQTKLKNYLTNIIHIFQYLILYKMRHFKTLSGFIWFSTCQFTNDPKFKYCGQCVQRWCGTVRQACSRGLCMVQSRGFARWVSTQSTGRRCSSTVTLPSSLRSTLITVCRGTCVYGSSSILPPNSKASRHLRVAWCEITSRLSWSSIRFKMGWILWTTSM